MGEKAASIRESASLPSLAETWNVERRAHEQAIDGTYAGGWADPQAARLCANSTFTIELGRTFETDERKQADDGDNTG